MPERLPRKLAAIFYADVADYSRLTGEDEDGTHRALSSSLDLLTTSIDSHNGRVVHFAGDAVLAEFPSVMEALTCAVEAQRVSKAKGESLPEERRIQFRIGINLGDVIVDRDDIYGDGVNVAARLESLAEAGGICISRSVYEQVRNKLDFGYEFLGEQRVKNIAEPVEVYRVHPESELADTIIAKKRVSAKPRQWPMLAAAILIAAAAGVVMLQPWAPLVEPVSDETSTSSAQPSIAVLPFDNLSADAEQEYFVDGMTEDLITDLSKNSELFVTARNSSFAYKGKSPDAREVARELGVRYLLEGSVRKVGNQVRINAQLIDGTTGGHIWAERYDGALDDVFALQDEVTQKILVALAVSLASDGQDRQPQRETENSQAYDLFLKGWAHYRRQAPDHYATAQDYFMKAVELDPEYSRAHAALASIYWRSFRDDFYPALQLDRQVVKARVKEHLSAAMKNPTPLAHQVAAHQKMWRGRFEEALAEAERAVSLDANDADSHVTLAEVLIFAGKPKEAAPLIDRARRLDPHNEAELIFLEGLIQFGTDDFDLAAASFERAIELNPELWSPDVMEPGWCDPCEPLAAAFGHLGRREDAERVLEQVRAQGGYDTVSGMMYWWPFKEAADRDRMAEGLRKAGVSD